MKKTFAVLTLCAGALISGTAQATLINRGGGLIYDTDLNITWLQDANYAQTSGYDSDGLMRWDDAKVWADQLVYGGYDNWRLPHADPLNGISYGTTYSPLFKADGTSEVGYNISEVGTAYAGITASEMAFLFYNSLDNKGYCPVSVDCQPNPQAGWGLTNIGPFINLESDLLFRYFWSDEGYSPATGPYPILAFAFDFEHGSQNTFPTWWQNDGHQDFYAWAVRDGDVAAIPEPETWALFLIGLGLLGIRSRTFSI